MARTVTAEGQVTIPKGLRDLPGIAPGSRVDFNSASSDGSIVHIAADSKEPVSRLKRLKGHAGKGLDTDAIMKLTRGDT